MIRDDRFTRTVYQTVSRYQEIYVGEQFGVRFLRFGGPSAGWQGALVLRRPERLYFAYQQAFSMYACLRSDIRGFLAVGAGTGTALAHVFRKHPQARCVAVEVDAAVIDVARRYFAAPQDDRVQWVEADALCYVPQMTEAFDLVFLDVFYKEKTPEPFFSPFFLRKLTERLSAGGVLAINAILPVAGRRAERFQLLVHTLAELVGPVYSVRLGGWPQTADNVVLFAQRPPRPPVTLRDVRRCAAAFVRAHPREFGLAGWILPLRLRREDL